MSLFIFERNFTKDQIYHNEQNKTKKKTKKQNKTKTKTNKKKKKQNKNPPSFHAVAVQTRQQYKKNHRFKGPDFRIMCLPDLKNLTFSLPIFRQITSIPFSFKDTQFWPHWVLSNLDSFVFIKKLPIMYTTFAKSTSKGEYTYVHNNNVKPLRSQKKSILFPRPKKRNFSSTSLRPS